MSENITNDKTSTSGGKLNPAALLVADAAKALGVSEDVLRSDIAAGAPVNPDGTLNVIHYAAWLNAEMNRESDGN